MATVEIAKAFRLRSIGGTSAGAIAAAGAAAAEAARQRHRKGKLKAGNEDDGFKQLENLPQYLAASSPEGLASGLQKMFHPHPHLATLFNRFMATLSIEKKSVKGGRIALCLLATSFFALLIGIFLWAMPLAYTIGNALTFRGCLWILMGGSFAGSF